MSLTRNEAARAAICANCAYLDACGTKQIFMSPDGGIEEGRCKSAQPLLQQIEHYLLGQGMGASKLRSMLVDHLERTGVLQPQLEPPLSPDAVRF